MSATILTYETEKMSAIFPTKPPEATVHFIPKNAEFISYRVEDNLVLSAWMPDGLFTVSTPTRSSNDNFYNDNCDGCERNSCSFLEDYLNEDGEINYDDIPNGHCDVYEEGYHGQECPLGYKKEEDLIDFSVANMVFEVHISHQGLCAPFSRQTDTAYLCGGKLTEENEIVCTDVYMASNVFGNMDNLEGICWGYNRRPHNLSEVVSEYISSPFNNDLLSVREFCYNSNQTRLETSTSNYGPVEDGETYLCSGKSALLLLHASQNVAAFFQMISAGFTSLPKAPHIMILPLSERVITLGQHSISGYCTDFDALGKQWFVSSTGAILGQVDGF